MVGVAVKVIEVPAQADVADADTLTESVTDAFTVTVIARLVAVAGVTQPPDGVITQVIVWLPAVSVEVVSVAPVPILVVPSFHT